MSNGANGILGAENRASSPSPCAYVSNDVSSFHSAFHSSSAFRPSNAFRAGGPYSDAASPSKTAYSIGHHASGVDRTGVCGGVFADSVDEVDRGDDVIAVYADGVGCAACYGALTENVVSNHLWRADANHRPSVV